jgi:hypothetical protein
LKISLYSLGGVWRKKSFIKNQLQRNLLIMKIAVTSFVGFVALMMMSFIISKDDPPRYKNLKILPKNTTKEEMDSLMHHFAASVG